MTAHARKGWTMPQAALGLACAVLGVAIGVLGFIDIYITVTRLLSQWWHGWSWTVIVLGEGSFTGCYCGWLLLDLRDHPPRRVVAFLACYLASFAAVSLALNLYAGRHGFPDAASHVMVVAAFFGYLMFAKVLVRRLSADPRAVALAVALADARQYAIDLCRSLRGPLWRWRVPALLRRHILSGRLCDIVREDVRLKIETGRTSGWEATVREWVLGPDCLNLSARAEADARMVAAGIARSTVPDAPETAPGAMAEPVPQAAPKPARTAAPGTVRKPSPSAARKMSGTDLAPYVGTLLETAPGLTRADVMKSLRIGRDKAAEALRIARRERTVVPMGTRHGKGG